MTKNFVVDYETLCLRNRVSEKRDSYDENCAGSGNVSGSEGFKVTNQSR